MSIEFEKPWVEKYRPTSLSEVVGNEQIVSQLRTISAQGNVPNMILVGPPGTGKTTSIMAMAHELLGENFSKATLELNASDDRGIEVVRDKIKSFANIRVNLPPNRHKIIILDEVDSMTDAAQQALRIIISDYSATTRFALACNDSTKIIEPIQSRCSVLRFTRLKPEDIKNRLMKIISDNNIEYDLGGIKALTDTADGDMRYALNNLQSTFVGYGFISHENVYKIVDIPRPEILVNLCTDLKNANFNKAIESVRELMDDGYNGIDIVGVLNKIIQDSEDFEDKVKFEILKEISMVKMRFLEGIDNEVQMYGFIGRLYELMNNKEK